MGKLRLRPIRTNDGIVHYVDFIEPGRGMSLTCKVYAYFENDWTPYVDVVMLSREPVTCLTCLSES